jgi:hypothetical protein
MKLAKHVACMWATQNTLVKKSDGKRSLGRPKHTHRWEDNTKMDLKKQDLGCWSDWSGSWYGLEVGSCEHNNELLD